MNHQPESITGRVVFARTRSTPGADAHAHAELGGCMYYACMPHVQVRDVPDVVHDVLVRRARSAGQSLQQYLAAELTRLAGTPTLDEVLDRVETHATGHLSASDAVRSLEAERDRH